MRLRSTDSTVADCDVLAKPASDEQDRGKRHHMPLSLTEISDVCSVADNAKSAGNHHR